MTVGMVFDIRKFSIQDGPGIRTTVFLKGCPLSCWWCHNPESQRNIPELIHFESRCVQCGACVGVCRNQAIPGGDLPKFPDLEKCTVNGDCVSACVYDARQLSGEQMDVSAVTAVLKRDAPFYEQSGGGATFSGGEPLSQPAFLLELLQACKAEGWHTAVDTSGHAPWRVFASILPYTDLFLYDLKLMNDPDHQKYTGNGNKTILDNLKRLAASDAALRIRIPIIPEITDTSSNLQAIVEFIQTLPGEHAVDLLPYHSAAIGKHKRVQFPYNLNNLQSPSEEHLRAIIHFFAESGIQAFTGG